MSYCFTSDIVFAVCTVFFSAKFTAEDLELLRLFEIESAANYRQRVEEQKRTGTEERIRKTNER